MPTSAGSGLLFLELLIVFLIEYHRLYLATRLRLDLDFAGILIHIIDLIKISVGKKSSLRISLGKL